MSNQKPKSNEFLEKLVKKMLLEQESSYISDDGTPMLSPDDQGQGIDPLEADIDRSDPIPLELRGAKEFKQALMSDCGSYRDDDNKFVPAPTELVEKDFAPDCLFLRGRLRSNGFDGTPESLDRFNRAGGWNLTLAHNMAIIMGIDVEGYKKERTYTQEIIKTALEDYRKEKKEIGDKMRKQQEQNLKDLKDYEEGKGLVGAARNTFSFLYQLFTEDAQEFFRDIDRNMDRDYHENNLQLAVMSLNKIKTEGVGGTQLERVRNHSIFYSQYANKTGSEFEDHMAKKYTKGINKFVPATWDPSFYRIHEKILEFIVDFIEKETPRLIERLKKANRRDDATGQIIINREKVRAAYQRSFNYFQATMKRRLDTIFAPGKTHSIKKLGHFGFRIFKNESYINNLLDNISDIFFMQVGQDTPGWSGGSLVRENIDEQQRPSYPSSTSIYNAGRKAQGRRDLDAAVQTQKDFDRSMVPYDLPRHYATKKIKNGRWSPLVLFLLTLRGFDFFSENVKVQVKGKKRSKYVKQHGLTLREYHNDAQKGLIFSKNVNRRRAAMASFVDTWASMNPAEFFNDYYINKRFIPSLFDKNKEDSQGHITQWVAFQRAVVYDPTSEIAQNADRSWGAYGDQKIQDKDGKTREIPKGYAYFVEWTKDTFDLFEKEQLVQKIADYNTNVTFGLIYGIAEWSGAFRLVSGTFGLLESTIHQATRQAWREGGRVGALRFSKSARVGLRIAALGRWFGSWGRASFIAGALIGVVVIFDVAGWFDIKKDFSKKYAKIEKHVCEFKDLCEFAKQHPGSASHIKKRLITIYQNIILAYGELITFYTNTISTVAGQGISKRDMIFYERFKVVARLQYFQKYEVSLKNLFTKCLEDANKLSDKEVVEILQDMEKAGFDPGEHCENLKKQVTQLQTKAKKESESVLVPTGTPESWTGFPVHEDLLGNRAKNKDELQSALEALQSKTDADPKTTPIGIPYTTFVDTMRNINREEDPLQTWIGIGIENIEKAINWSSNDALKDESSEESEKIQKENKLLSESVNWNRIRESLEKYYGKGFDSDAANVAIFSLIKDREKFSSEISPSKDKNPARKKMISSAMRGFHDLQNTGTIRRMEEFTFIKRSAQAKALFNIIKSARQVRGSIAGYKTDEFSNYSNFFSDSSGRGVYYTARMLDWSSNRPAGSHKFIYTTYSNFQAQEYAVGFREPSEIFTKLSSPLHNIVDAGRKQKTSEQYKILPRPSVIDLDAVWKIFDTDSDDEVTSIIKNTIDFWLFDPNPGNQNNPDIKYGANRRISLLLQSFNINEGLFKDFRSIETVEEINNKISQMQSILNDLRSNLSASVDPDSVGDIGANKGQITRKYKVDTFKMLQFHINLMKFLNSSVKPTWIRDWELTMKMRKSLMGGKYETVVGSKNLERHIKNKMFFFLQMGNISESIDKHFGDDIALNFNKIRLSKGIIQ